MGGTLEVDLTCCLTMKTVDRNDPSSSDTDSSQAPTNMMKAEPCERQFIAVSAMIDDTNGKLVEVRMEKAREAAATATKQTRGGANSNPTSIMMLF